MPSNHMTGYVLDGNTRTELTVDLATLHYQPAVQSWNHFVDQHSVLAQPNTFSWDACSVHGLIGVDTGKRMNAIHLHLMSDGSGGQFDLEIWRQRTGGFVRVATCTFASGGGSGALASFVFPDEASRLCEPGDYFFLQATSKMSGNPVGFVDVHYDPVPLILINP